VEHGPGSARLESGSSLRLIFQHDDGARRSLVMVRGSFAGLCGQLVLC